MTAPKIIIKDGLVVNHEQLKSYYLDKYRRDYLIRRGMFRDLAELQDEPPLPDPLPTVLPEHRLMKKLLEVEGIANYAKQKAQERLIPSRKKRPSKYT